MRARNGHRLRTAAIVLSLVAATSVGSPSSAIAVGAASSAIAAAASDSAIAVGASLSTIAARTPSFADVARTPAQDAMVEHVVLTPQQAVDLTPQQAVDRGVAEASSDGVDQYVALVDRSTGKLVASSGGDTQVISESIVKLFTVGYYLVKYNGDLPDDIATDLHEMIVHSNDRIESQYWTTAAVPAMAARYGLTHTANGAKTGPHDWGWEYITADDEAMFLYKMSKDPVVGPFLMDAMANVASVGSDGFDQGFGFNSLDGDHGSKQGWTDLNTSSAINIHSVGWTSNYFGAILETSDSPQYNTMRADSTATADLIAALKSPAQIRATGLAAIHSAAGALQTAVRQAITAFKHLFAY